ncbi:chemotaxis protein [Paenibacillus thailandensis]|uniref:chemotaxis protein n=1 Tax=Paenibacillus thailandensis TaxID=393250 RepID=UPI003628B857
MPQKLAVIVIHGLGRHKEDFADRFMIQLKKRYADAAGINDPGNHLAIRPVHWAEILEVREERLKARLYGHNRLRYKLLRNYLIHYLADAVAYQPLEVNDQIYRDIHATISTALQRLTEEAGPEAPLCAISHSMGTVIASNYFYDMQNATRWKPDVLEPGSPLARGETLSLFYSCGTTLPLWSLRYRDFDRPIRVPADAAYAAAKGITGEWVNFYDRDDILGYPLRSIDPAYGRAVREDVQINAGGMLRSWNPFSHGGYFTNGSMLRRIAAGLVRTWREANQQEG